MLVVILLQRNGTGYRLLHLDIYFAYGIGVLYHKATTKTAATMQIMRVRLVYISMSILYASTTRGIRVPVFEYRYSSFNFRYSTRVSSSSTQSGIRATLTPSGSTFSNIAILFSYIENTIPPLKISLASLGTAPLHSLNTPSSSISFFVQ